MVLSHLKQKVLDRKIERVRQEVRDLLKRTPGGVETIFSAFKIKPSALEFENMVVASRFGPGDPLFVNGDFGTEYIFGEYPGALKQLQSVEVDRSLPANDDEGNLVCLSYTITEPWANLVLMLCAAGPLVPFLPETLEETEFAFDPELGLYVDKASGQIGLVFSVSTMQLVTELMKGDKPVLSGDAHFIGSSLKSNDHATVYQIKLAPVLDLLDAEQREKHEVQGHQRQLSSGRIVPVREHKRMNPRQTSHRRNLDEVRYVVYLAFDIDGHLRYIGEGTESRPAHVNSGASHNYKLNEHFFRRGRMRVEILKTGLSKSEALAIGQLLIRRHAGAQLWNIKDNEQAPPELEGKGRAE